MALPVTDAEFLAATCRDSFDAFAARAFKIIEPGTKYEWSWHIDCIAEHLMASFRGELPRLIINLPPRTLKSYQVARSFPAWVMGKTPQAKFISTSYGYEVTEQNAMACRRIMKDPWYKSVFPKTVISPDLDRNTHFETTQAGQYYAASALSPITGIGCFVAGTMIDTNIGPVAIEELPKIHQNIGNCLRILSYCHDTNSLQYRRLLAFEPKQGKDIVDVRSASGRHVRCTADHRIYSDGQYREANDIQEGAGIFCHDNSSVLSMSETIQNPIGRNKQKETKDVDGRILRKDMLKRGSFNKEQPKLQNVQQQSKASRTVLLNELQDKSKRTKTFTEQIKKTKTVSYLQEYVSCSSQWACFLFKIMRGLCTFQAYAWQPELSLQRGRRPIYGTIQENKIINQKKRREYLCGMQRNSSSVCSSYKRAKRGQQSGKSNNFMPALSHNTSQIEKDTISSVARVSTEPITVYDITIEGTHNFFANGILVHNCDYMLCDDLIKPMEASSEAIRTSTNINIRQTLFSRFNDKRIGRFILVMQRVHEDDPTGHLLKDGGYFHLKLPAENRTGKTISYALNNKKWDMEPGALLFPSRLSREILDQSMLDMTQAIYAGQMLQEPVPMGGGEFLPEWPQHYPNGSIRPKTMNVYILVDAAGGDDTNKKKRKTSDRTAMAVIGSAPDNNYYLLDLVIDRLNATERIDMLFLLHRKWNDLCGKPPRVGYEKYGLMTDTHYAKKRMDEEGYRFGLIELGGRMAKEERIRRMIPDLQKSRWYFPDNLLYTDCEGRTLDMVKELLNSEMSVFPRGRYDDGLDAVTRIYDSEMGALFPKVKIKSKIPQPAETKEAWVTW